MAQYSIEQLAEALRIRKLIDETETQLAKLQDRLNKLMETGTVSTAVKRGAQRTSAAGRKVAKKAGRKVSRKGRRKGPGMKALVHEVLREAGRPLNTDEIMAAMQAKGYKSGAKAPRKTLGVLLYTDKSLQRPGRGLFAAPATGKAKTVSAKKK